MSYLHKPIKPIVKSLPILGLVMLIFQFSQNPTFAQDGQLTIESLVLGDFETENYGTIHWISDGESFVKSEKNETELHLIQAKNLQTDILFKTSDLSTSRTQTKIRSFDFSPDESKILLTLSESENRFLLLDRKSNETSVVDLGKWQKGSGQLRISPDNSKLAFIYNSDIYLYSIGNKEISQLTFINAEQNQDRNGDALERVLDFSWSPDSRFIAFTQENAEGVNFFRIINNTKSLYPEVTEFRHVKPGEKMAEVKVGTVDLSNLATRWISSAFDSQNHYIRNLTWRPNAGHELIIEEMNRNQNILKVLEVDMEDGSVQPILEEKEETYLEPFDLVWLDQGKQFLWMSERDGWRHLYTVSQDGSDIRLISPGEFDVVEFVQVDQDNKWVYFIASPESAVNRYMYRTRLDGKGNMELLSPASEVGVNSYEISPSGTWAIREFSNFETPPTFTLVSLPDHSTKKVLEDNSILKEKMAHENLMPVEYYQVSVEAGLDLDYRMIKPVGFDPSNKYPVIYHVYSMPASQISINRWVPQNSLYHQILARNGFVVITIDGRGTPAPNGKAWRKSIYKKHGVLPADDIARATQNMLKSHPFIDEKNIGVYGWSGGGLMSMLLILRYPDLFEAAVPGAYISHHKYYQAAFTERFMGLPQDNPEAYEETAALNYADGLEGKLMIIHGTGDTNVHYQNTEAMINALIHNQKYFTVLPYPNRNHAFTDNDAKIHRLKAYLTFFSDQLKD